MGLLARTWERKARTPGIGYPHIGWAPASGGRLSTSGVFVNDETANTVAAWFAAVRKVSKDVATLPLITYRRVQWAGADGRVRPAKERAYDHPLYTLLHDAPNPRMTSITFRETLQGHLLTWGNAYAEKELNGRGETVALWPLRPDRITVTIGDDGQVVYEYTVRPGTAPVRLPKRNVFHIPGFGFDGLIGYSVLALARETLGQTVSLREYGSRVLANDARPGVILKHPGQLSDPAIKHLRDSWEASHGGFSNAGRTAIIEEGMDVTVLGLPREDMLFLAAQKWQVADIARWIDIAPHKIGDLEHATFSNIEEQNIDHAWTLQSHLSKWEQQIKLDLITDPTIFAEHLLDAVLRGKTLERAQALQVMAQNMALTPNEWRDKENMNPVAWGDEPISTPNNSAPPADSQEPVAV